MTTKTPTAIESQGRELTIDAPSIVEPRPDAPVDANYATFSWDSVPFVDGYILEIARDAEFTEIIVDVAVGDATTLTLFETFLPDGNPRYARVSAVSAAAESAYSEVIAFVPVTDAEFDRASTQPKQRPLVKARPAQAKPQAVPVSAEAVMPPWMNAHTSTAWAVTFVGAVMAGFAMLILIALLA
jgi:hypothetical protein